MLNTNVSCLRLTGRQKPHQSLSILSASPQRPHYILNSQLFPQQKNEHTWHPCAEPVNGEPGRVSPETSGLTFKRAGGKPTPPPPPHRETSQQVRGGERPDDGWRRGDSRDLGELVCSSADVVYVLAPALLLLLLRVSGTRAVIKADCGNHGNSPGIGCLISVVDSFSHRKFFDSDKKKAFRARVRVSNEADRRK